LVEIIETQAINQSKLETEQTRFSTFEGFINSEDSFGVSVQLSEAELAARVEAAPYQPAILVLAKHLRAATSPFQKLQCLCECAH
jgi:hypothetical protein